MKISPYGRDDKVKQVRDDKNNPSKPNTSFIT